MLIMAGAGEAVESLVLFREDPWTHELVVSMRLDPASIFDVAIVGEPSNASNRVCCSLCRELDRGSTSTLELDADEVTEGGRSKGDTGTDRAAEERPLVLLAGFAVEERLAVGARDFSGRFSVGLAVVATRSAAD